VAWAIVVIHQCQVLDDLNCLGAVNAPHHTICAQFNISCSGLYDELMSYSVVLQLRRPSLLGLSEHSDKGSQPGAVHGQQHHVFAWPHDETLHAWWVLPGRLLAGEYPGARTPGKATKKLQLLIDAGIDSIVDLTTSQDPLEPYQEQLRAAAEKVGHDVRHFSYPIPDMGSHRPGRL
jgi:hypothetical protein